MLYFKLFISFLVIFNLFFGTHFAQSNTQDSLLKKIVPNIDQPLTQKDTIDASETIKAINISGNNAVSLRDIVSVLTIREGDRFNDYHLNRNLKRIKKMGFFQAVDSSVEESKQGKTISIVLTEYPAVTSILFEGNHFFTDDYLKEMIQSKPNTIYNISDIKQDMILISDLYSKSGLFNAKIYNAVGPVDQDGPLTFYIAEGVVEDIIISGNMKTQDYVILREMSMRPGDPIRDVSLQKDIRRIYNLQYFEDIQPEVYPGEKEHQYVLKFNIKERETSGSFAVGGGYSPNSGFNLFSDLYWDNLLGTGRMVMLKGNLGLANEEGENKNSTFQFRYTDPWAFGNRRSLSLRAWLTQGSLSAYNPLSSNFSFRNEYRTGFDALIGVPHSYDFRSSHRIKYESVDLQDISYVYKIYSYELGLIYDKRDVAINSRSGSYYELSIEKALSLSSNAIDFTQYDITYKKFIPTFKKQTIASQLRLGLLRSDGFDNDDIMVAQQYYVGGSRTVRGYPDHKPFGKGDKQVLFSTEYRFLVNSNLYYYFFVDAGYASEIKDESGNFIHRDYKDLSHYKLSKGIGVSLVVPGLGPLKLDYGITENNHSMIQFNMGYSF